MLGPAPSAPDLEGGRTRLPPATKEERTLLSLPAFLRAVAMRGDTVELGPEPAVLVVGGVVVRFPPLPLGTHSL